MADHQHGDKCGHTALKHGDHIVHLVNGQLDCDLKKCNSEAIPSLDHKLDVKSRLVCKELRCHDHSEMCGHEEVQHGDHMDYIVDGKIHHNHNGHCDYHLDLVEVNAIRSQRRKDLKREENIKKFYKDKNAMKFIIMLILIGGYFLVELVYGAIIGSLTLVADAMHMLTDAIALSIGFYSLMISRIKRTNKATFGFARMEVVGGLINASLLLAVAFNIFVESITKLIKKEENEELINNSLLLIIVASIGFAINIIGIFIFSHDHHHHGNEDKHQNFNMRAVFLHVLGDTLGSVAVIVSGLVVRFSSWENRTLIDPICSLVISLIIFTTTVPVLKGSSSVLLEKVPTTVSLKEIEQKCISINSVLNVHEMHVWQLNGSKFVGSCHIVLQDDTKVHQIIEEVKQVFHSHGVHSTSIQPEIAVEEEIWQDRNGAIKEEKRNKVGPKECYDLICEADNCVENACCPPENNCK